MAVILPDEPLPATAEWPRKLFLYGQPKVGKTTILSQLPGCLILECDEGGADYVSALKIQLTGINDFREVCAMLAKNRGKYKFIALDTVTKFEEWCEPLATEDYRSSPQGKNFKGDSVLTLLSSEGFSPGYQWLRLAFQREIRKLAAVADNLILIGHLKDKYLKSLDNGNEKGKDSSEVYSRDIDLTGRIKAMMTSGCDAIGFLYRTAAANDPTQQKLWVSFRTKEITNCGTRPKHLINQEFIFDWNKIYPPQS